jgi:MoxR-like ATPase
MARHTAQGIVENVEKVIIGKSRSVELTVIALMCGGHALIEDVPGVGKTMLARSIARSVGCEFKRIQFTPDLLPTDVTGVSIYNQKTGDFEFRQGPIIAQIVLADEINRATPKTQSAMLEAMEERQVTVEGITHKVPSPFMIMATQNPVEYEGTFPLPEAQLDRFLLLVSLGYPTNEEELAIIEGQQVAHPIDSLEPITSPKEIIELQESVKEMFVDDLIKRYIVTVVEATRDHPDISLGASPRGSLALFRGAQALALIRNREFALPDDVKELAVPMLSHRIIVSAAARMRGIKATEIITNIVNDITVPGAQAADRARR